MVLEIVWTKRAEIGYAKIVNYLEAQFTEKEVRKFVRESIDFFELLSKYPEILKGTEKQKNVRRGAINKYTILTYRVNQERNKSNLSIFDLPDKSHCRNNPTLLK